MNKNYLLWSKNINSNLKFININKTMSVTLSFNDARYILGLSCKSH